MAEPQEDTATATESRLDTLLSEYLHLLDRYIQLRAQLSTHLASGFLALAHANRNAAQTLGAGRYYGEDSYDGRMKATRRVQIRGQASFSTTTTTPTATATAANTTTANTTASTPGKASSETDEKQKQEQEQDQENENENVKDQNQPQTRDPLRWFGLLVPPALRQCQSHFAHSVATAIPELLTVMAEMRAAEDEIAKARRELGLEEKDEHTKKSQEAAHLHPTNAHSPTHHPPTPPPTSSNSSNHPLTTFVSRSRPSEPRPRVLTLDGASLS